VFFGPYEEDYGYVTLEAMLSRKPVITCEDSGGPTEFVVDGESGWVVPPAPEAVAAALDALWDDEDAAVRLGRQGRVLYDDLDISWDAVVDALVTA
jgi:glycosyltransferase involved in cell wall biosynthesis